MIDDYKHDAQASELVSVMARQRREVHFEGRVQGVGFRFTTRRIAGRFAVSGYVQNLPDGRVRLVAEGEEEELDRFLAAVARQLADYISRSETVESPATGEFEGFDVRI